MLLESFTYKEIAIGIDSVAIGECKKNLKGLEKKKTNNMSITFPSGCLLLHSV